MDSNLEDFEKIFVKIENTFTKTGIFPCKKPRWIRYLILILFILTFIGLIIKLYLNPEHGSVEGGIINIFGCHMAMAFLIRIIVSEARFITVIDFIRKDFRETPSEKKQKILKDIADKLQRIFTFFAYVFPSAIIPKIFTPFLEYGFAVLVENNQNASITVNPSMIFPRMSFLYRDDLMIYILEIIIVTVPLYMLLYAAMLFGLTSLYIGGCFRVLAMELEKLSIDDTKAFVSCLRRHNEIIE